ncbi:MAG TPA: hypothetical protein VN699_09270, partial [Pirellulales bacterium]|nr:hypothetical protein [Pirellulales bacterium]
MRSFKILGVAGCAALGVAALIVGARAWGQDAAARGQDTRPVAEEAVPEEAPVGGNTPASEGQSSARESAPSVGLSGTAPARPRYNGLFGSSGAGNQAVAHLFELSGGQLQQADAQLTQQTEALASQYGEASKDEDREKIKAELSELLAKQFSIQQQIREDEVAQIEARVKKLRELIEKRKAAQQSIIKQRFEQLLRDAEGLGSAPSAE